MNYRGNDDASTPFADAVATLTDAEFKMLSESKEKK